MFISGKVKFMAKSRVAKNKALYEELEKEEFDLVDIVEENNITKEVVEEKVEVKVDKKSTKKQAVVPVVTPKQQVIVVNKKAKPKVEVVEEVPSAQPVSYKDKLSVEELLRAKLEKQQQLKDSKRIYKRTPYTETYTPAVMQKNINQRDGINVRKEVNIRVRQGNKAIGALLTLLLIIVIVVGVLLICFIF